MKKAMRIMYLSALFFLSVTLVFAAGQQDKKAASDDGVTFSWWALSGGGGVDDPRELARQEMIDEYEASHPGVHIELVMLENEAFKQKIQVAIQAGNPPDMFHSWGGGVMIEYAKSGMLRDITDAVNNDLSKRIGIGTLGVYGDAGKYYGGPYDMGAVGMWYNKDIFKEVGVAVPETWDDLLKIVPKIKAAGYVPIALGGGDKWPAHFWWVYLAMRVGGKEAFDKAYNGTGSFADEPFVRAGEKLLELVKLDPFQTGYLGSSYDDEAALMGNKKAAMELMGQWAPGVQVANSVNGEGLGSSLGWFSFPAVAGGAGKLTDVMGGGGGYVLGKNAPDEAVDFLKFLLNKENNITLSKVEGSIPVVAGAEVALEGNENAVKMVKAIASADYYQLYYDQFLPPAVGEAVKDAVANLFAGVSTPKESAEAIQSSWEDNK
ncbi:extracellular solute-binding protein [Oceanispirochaeta sp.]|jgi:raffinose/stachyose/melibiose transport system substrate-binding protein|uniref:extracellular solute-binding protein n=1 Tax=Oceanispirochaeta sp. TaxID=2035350 RepID=UPI00263848C1|nr:extracellular solute-binding protein [Oceanispirochaeta sp.]MDA3956270.1 extracellular solute-binding protein [Oceanispirochaeta sp.]